MSQFVRPMALHTLVQLVNAWGTHPRRARGEQDVALPSPAGLVDDPALAGQSVARLVTLADVVHPVFAEKDDETRASLVTALLERSQVRPVLVSDDGLHGAWVVPHAASAPLAAATVALWLQLGAGAGDRLGTCADSACADAYVDLSPGGHRRFCSTTCQNRSRTAAFRRRRAAKPVEPGGPATRGT